MTEVTRIACPGCRALLRFEPEALDNPANCAACECRFSVGVYVRVTCPNCQNGSRCRDSSRGQRLRCNRCKHEFLTDEGLPPGGGGRLLVARRLDVESPERTETIQPFLGHAREDAASKVVEPEPDAVRALRAERDRLAEELALLKAVLARIVGQPADPTSGAAAEPSMADDRPAPEERDRLEKLVQGLRAELHDSWAEIERLRERASREESSARSAEERMRRMERDLDRADRARAESERNADRLAAELSEALRASEADRSALEAVVSRLTRAVQSAQSGEALALDRLEEFAARVIRSDAEMAEEVAFERQKAVELAGAIEGLRAEIRTARAESAASETLAEERWVAIVEAEGRHRAEIERLEGTIAGHEEAKLAHFKEKQRLTCELEMARTRDEAPYAENERLGETVDRLLEENLNLVEESERIQAENRRMQAELAESRNSTQAEKDRLAGELEHAKGEAGRRNSALVAEIQRVKKEYEKLSHVNESLSDRVRELLEGEPTGSEPTPTSSGALPGGPPASAADEPELQGTRLPNRLGVAREVPPSHTPGASVLDEVELVVSKARTVEIHRDVAMTLIYGDTLISGHKPGRRG